MGWQNSFFQLLIIEVTPGFSGLFVYSPAPGPGNLIGSWTAAAGTDPYGNTYPAGLSLAGVAALLTITDPAVIKFIAGATTTGTIQSRSATQSLQINAPNNLSLTGGDVILGSLHHIFPGSDATGTVPQPWQTPLSFSNGWSGTFKWRYGVENEVKFQCGLNPGTVADGTLICNLFGVFPPVAQMHAVWTDALKVSGATFESSALQLDASGNLRCFGISTAATTVTGVGFWPLDN